ncbi:MAG TPA: pyrroloquinoline quinone-dependent dehydrogenase, partial [Gammaproteobacteria bacterium]|nr:pyrroloquinoline quinone-dependent dehydrogenase [Gammaproteobacteria bacterium]
NVAQLRVVWRHPQADPKILADNPDLSLSNRYMATPIYVDGRLYVPNGFGLAEAIDPKTGRTLWTQTPLIAGVEGLPSLMISKGVAYWGSGADARIFNVR